MTDYQQQVRGHAVGACPRFPLDGEPTDGPRRWHCWDTQGRPLRGIPDHVAAAIYHRLFRRGWQELPDDQDDQGEFDDED